jgi:D-alanyl-D-alanine carboxypeptidase
MRDQHALLVALLVFTGLGTACQPSAPPEDPHTGIKQELQRLVDAAVEENASIHGAALHVDSPTLGLSWEGASGLADPTAGEPMTPAHPVRIASNTKTYVAAATLRLWEDGKLELDDPIAEHLPAETVESLRGDGYQPEEMTVRHLLTHTSGLFDHSDSELYVQAIVAEPQRRWTRADQVRGAVEWGDPLGAPGELFSYADTGYVLLGAIVERVDGRPLHQAVRELMDFDGLGLDSTWWETLEPRPEGVPERAHQFLGELDVTGFDPSYDLYGGGGLAATVGDMASFMRALFSGSAFERPSTTDTMLTTVEGAGARPDGDGAGLPPGAYRMGVWVVEVGGFTTYRHSGFWGTLATYVPELDLALAVTLNQNGSKEALETIVHEVVSLIGSIVDKQETQARS